MQPILFVVLLVAAFLAVFALLKLAGFLIAFLRFINGDETAMSRYFDRNRERRGYTALADGIVALAEGRQPPRLLFRRQGRAPAAKA